MREIKFRAWHAGNKNEQGAFYRGHEPKMLYDEKLGDCLRWLAERQNITGIMQFTGLKDINGVEIYEGDVVKGQRHLDRPGQFARFIGAVEYDEWWGAYRRKGVKQYQGLDADLRHGRELEVIGNIYQNPELTEPQ